MYFNVFSETPRTSLAVLSPLQLLPHPVLIYSLNHIAVLAKLLLRIEEKFTDIFSANLVCISRGSTGDTCDRVAFNLDSALNVTVCPLTWKELL